ncbi:MAG: hypothetical protein LC790_08075 [Actinobacteria bacterium]|nr:hypothetical protein [Actinomycetota bacterium]
MQHDEDITSDEFDALLDDSETLDAEGPSNATEMRLYVAVDSETLQELQQRAAAAGTDLNVAAANALRAGARAA